MISNILSFSRLCKEYLFIIQIFELKVEIKMFNESELAFTQISSWLYYMGDTLKYFHKTKFFLAKL